MKKLLIGVGVLLLLSLNVEAGKKVKKMSVYFETDKHELSEKDLVEISEFISDNVQGQDFEILVEGHADLRGNLAYNDALSMRRAGQVQNFIKTQGISAKLIELSFFGERKPMSNSISARHLSQNRRVDVILNTYTFESLEEIQEALKENSVSNFEVDPNQEALLKAKNGSRVYIQVNSFVDEDGNPVKEQVMVEVSEAIKQEEWVANNLSTESKGEVIVSGGMLKVLAKTVSGEQVKLDPNRPILVSLPNLESKADKDMELFASPNGATWSPVGNRPFNLSAVEMRPFPRRKYVHPKYTAYKVNNSTRPQKPIPLYRPNEPHKPREIDMRWNIHWYTINKKGKEQKNIENYHKQLANYYSKMERFKRSDNKYRNAELNHQKDLMTYKEDLKKWVDSLEIKRMQWKFIPKNLKAKAEADSLNKIYDLVYGKKVKKWKEDRREKVGKLADKMDDLGLTNSAALNTYVFTMNNLGWINCDKFMEVPASQKREVVIEDTDTSKKKVMLVFKNLNSTIQMHKHKGKYSNSQIPNYEEVVVFSFKVKDGKPYVYLQPLSAVEEKIKLRYRPSSFAEIKEILASFDQG